jgi:hypothetical protein
LEWSGLVWFRVGLNLKPVWAGLVYWPNQTGDPGLKPQTKPWFTHGLTGLAGMVWFQTGLAGLVWPKTPNRFERFGLKSQTGLGGLV